jgi:hypothetical protein
LLRSDALGCVFLKYCVSWKRQSNCFFLKISIFIDLIQLSCITVGNVCIFDSTALTGGI